MLNITSDTDVLEKDSFKIVCVIDGLPFPEVVWFKDNVMIQNQNNLRINVNLDGISSTISINSSSTDDSGMYTCVAINDVGSDNGTVTIQVKPSEYTWQ